jgi:hypothetical protein
MASRVPAAPAADPARHPRSAGSGPRAGPGARPRRARCSGRARRGARRCARAGRGRSGGDARREAAGEDARRQLSPGSRSTQRSFEPWPLGRPTTPASGVCRTSPPGSTWQPSSSIATKARIAQCTGFRPRPSKPGVVGSGLGRSAIQRWPSRARNRRRASSSASEGSGSMRSPVTPGSCRAVSRLTTQPASSSTRCLGCRIAEPESGRLAQHCGLAQQRLGEIVGEAGERPVLQHAGAQRHWRSPCGRAGPPAPGPGCRHPSGSAGSRDRRSARRSCAGRDRPAAGPPAS